MDLLFKFFIGSFLNEAGVRALSCESPVPRPPSAGVVVTLNAAFGGSMRCRVFAIPRPERAQPAAIYARRWQLFVRAGGKASGGAPPDCRGPNGASSEAVDPGSAGGYCFVEI